jgi:hypothetical protein
MCVVFSEALYLIFIISIVITKVKYPAILLLTNMLLLSAMVWIDWYFYLVDRFAAELYVSATNHSSPCHYIRPLHSLLNVLVQIANKMGFKKKCC